MKNLSYFLSVILVISFLRPANASNHIFTVISSTGPNSNNGYQFSPVSYNVNLGDSVTWEQDFSVHPLGSLSVPQGASSFAYTGNNSSFTYVVTVPGTYNFECTFHLFMGSFVASTTNAVQQVVKQSVSFSVYPNITHDVINLKVNDGIGTENKKLNVEVYNALGNKVLNFDFVADNPFQINIGNLASGIYFVALRKENDVVAVQKIIKQ